MDLCQDLVKPSLHWSQFDASVHHHTEERTQAGEMEKDQAFFVEFEEIFVQRHKGFRALRISANATPTIQNFRTL